MCIVSLDQSNNSLTKNLNQHEQLFDLLGTIELAAWEMYRAAEVSEKAKTKKAHPQVPQPHNTSAGEPREDSKVLASASQTDVAKAMGRGADPRACKGNEVLGPDSEGSEPKQNRKRKRRNSVASKGEKNPDATEKGHKRSYVEHNYVDHSQDLPMGDELKGTPKSRGGITTPFPVQLHDMLQGAVARGYSDIVSWQTHGRAFHVHDPARFVSVVMPMFFRQSRMSSFQRQLSLYGFLRLTRKGTDHGAYYHELFLRDMPHLCHRMMRTRVKGYWVRQSSSPESEPDFSTMPPVKGLPEEGIEKRVAAAPGTGPPEHAADIAPLDGSLWQLIGENRNIKAGDLSSSSRCLVSGSSLKPPPHASTMATSLNQVKMPPMPPLRPAEASPMFRDLMAQPAYCTTAQTLLEPSLQPSGGPQIQQKSPFDLSFRLPQSPIDRNDPMLDDDCDELHKHAMNMSPNERDDMAAFLSDVDLTSGDEDSVEEGFEEEAKIGRVASSSSLKKKRRYVSSNGSN